MIDKENICHNKKLFRILLLYYLDELSETDIESKIMESPDQRETICKYIAAWIRWDDELQAYLKGQFAGG